MPSSAAKASASAVPPPNALFFTTGDPEIDGAVGRASSSSSSQNDQQEVDFTIDPHEYEHHMRTVKAHSVSIVAHNGADIDDMDADVDILDETRPPSPSQSATPTPGLQHAGRSDPFLTPAHGSSASLASPPPSLPGSSQNLAQLAGATASRLSILSSAYNFGSLANGMGASGAPPVPALPERFSTHVRFPSNATMGASEVSLGLSPPPTGKRESFASPPLLYRTLPNAPPYSRRSSLRPGTGISERSAGDPLTPPSSAGSSPPGTSQGTSATNSNSMNKGSTSAGVRVEKVRRLKSSALMEGEEIEKPWLTSPNIRSRISWWLTFGVGFFGIVASFLRVFFGMREVQLLKGNLCLVLDDDFNGAEIDKTKWNWEVELGGFGNGEFEMTTNSPNNSFLEDGILYIVPTLTSDVIGSSAIFDGHTFNLTGCTSVNNTACGAVSNSTTRTVINPVQSARLSTRNTTSMKYGRVEVRARLPTGDWLWPAIWMLPVNETYGPFPASGEIDIMESRGNGPSYPSQGSNYVRAALNWGPLSFLNEVSKTFGWWNVRRGSFANDYHVYALEWTDQFIRAYVDTRLHFMLNLKFDEPFFKRGDFPNAVFNGSQEIPVQDPWPNNNVAPFDRPFFFLMDVAVGGTSGWFPDQQGNKPWLDQSSTAMYDFARQQDSWYTTWPTDVRKRGMAIDYVKMWELC